MPDPPFEVVPYSIGRLIQLLSSPQSQASEDSIRAKYHSAYFESYFHELQARTMVVERRYVDRDYLEDYAAYYARCFRDYPRCCTRLHFFSCGFSRDDFASLLQVTQSSLTLATLQESYLGFVVVRPLPQSVIGRTCLKTYPPDGNRRHFPVVRSYEANLFGLRLEIQSLAYQEQDRAAAACATAALWSVFQKTGLTYQHPIPSPVEITRSANTQFPMSSRGLPSSGLTTEQMAGAIRSVGQEPYLIEVKDEEILKSVLFAYLSGGVPVLLLFDLFHVRAGRVSPIGKHAVAVTGFSLKRASPSAGRSVNFKAGRIDKIYVHDDQVGPFARMKLGAEDLSAYGTSVSTEHRSCWDKCPLFSKPEGGSSLVAAWSDDHRAQPEFLLVPLYHKVRIPFEAVQEAVELFANLIAAFAGAPGSPFSGFVEWEVFLTCVNDFREGLLESKALSGEPAERVLCDNFPRFMWRATLCADQSPKVDLLFDATDIEQGQFFHRAVEYDAGISAYLRQVLGQTEVERLWKNTSAWQVIEWFRINAP